MYQRKSIVDGPPLSLESLSAGVGLRCFGMQDIYIYIYIYIYCTETNTIHNRLFYIYIIPFFLIYKIGDSSFNNTPVLAVCSGKLKNAVCSSGGSKNSISVL